MKAKFIYVFLTCLMIGGQFSLSAQNQDAHIIRALVDSLDGELLEVHLLGDDLLESIDSSIYRYITR